MTETFSSNAFSGVRFVPRLAQCSSVNGLHVGRILALPPEHKQPANVLDLSARHEVSFVFNAVADVETIKIQFGAHRRPSKGVVTSTIVSSTGQVISVHSMDLISIGDNKFCSLNDLRGSPLVSGKSYTIKLKLKGAQERTVFVWGNICAPLDEKTDELLIEADRGRSFFQRGIKPATSAMRAAIVTTVAMSRDPFVYLSALTASKGTPAVLTYDRLFWDWSSLVECDVVFFHNYAPLSAGFPLDEVCYALHRSGVVTVAIASDEHISNWPKLCHLSLDPSAHGRLFDNVDREQLRALNHIDFRQIIGEFEKRRTPSIVIVCSAVNLPQLIDFSNIIGTTKIASKVEFVCVGHEDERAFSHYVMKRFARSWSEALSTADQDIAFLVGPEIQATHQFIAAHKRIERSNLRVETLISIWFMAHLPSQSSVIAPSQLGRACSLPSKLRSRGRAISTLPPWKPILPFVLPQRCAVRSLPRPWRGPHAVCASASIISPSASSPAARQSLSKLAEMLASASIFNSLAGIAVDVISLFMALLSSRGISTPSLQAQGEQRRFFYFNNDRDIPGNLLGDQEIRVARDFSAQRGAK